MTCEEELLDVRLDHILPSSLKYVTKKKKELRETQLLVQQEDSSSGTWLPAIRKNPGDRPLPPTSSYIPYMVEPDGWWECQQYPDMGRWDEQLKKS